MSAQQNFAKESSPTIRIIDPIPVDFLSRLLKEYSERLIEKAQVLSQMSPIAARRGEDKGRAAEAKRDVVFLNERLAKLVEKASAYHEHMTLSEGERFELELRLFDAENALRMANRILPGY